MIDPPALARTTVSLTTLLLALGAATGCTQVRAPDAPTTTAAARAADDRPRRLYRLELVLTTTEPGRPASKSAHTLNVEEGRTASLRLGSNVALTSNARTDVGLHIDCNVTALGEEILLESGVELTSLDEGAASPATTIRKVSLRDDALLVAGRSAVVSSTEDPVSHARYEVTVTATKLR